MLDAVVPELMDEFMADRDEISFSPLLDGEMNWDTARVAIYLDGRVVAYARLNSPNADARLIIDMEP